MPRTLITYSRGEALRFVGHLDFARAWERVFRRAQVAVAYSQGFSPHAKLAFAAPLPVGMTAAAELLDATMRDDLDPVGLAELLAPQLPESLAIVSIGPLFGPSLSARLRHAEYRATLSTPLALADAERLVTGIMGAASAPMVRRRDREARHYDLRPFIDKLWIERWDTVKALGMRLVVSNAGAGRADEVLSALGLRDECQSLERTRLILADP